MSAARREAQEKVAKTRLMLIDAGAAGPVELVRWKAQSSGVMTRWHRVGSRAQLVVAPRYPEVVPTLCGLEFVVEDAWNVMILPEFDIPQDVLDTICGTCLLLGVRPLRPG